MPFSGPLGIWHFPILNFILSLTERKGISEQASSKQALNLSAENIEEWELLRDPSSGRLIGLRIHREVKQ